FGMNCHHLLNCDTCAQAMAQAESEEFELEEISGYYWHPDDPGEGMEGPYPTRAMAERACVDTSGALDPEDLARCVVYVGIRTDPQPATEHELGHALASLRQFYDAVYGGTSVDMEEALESARAVLGIDEDTR
ncbi:MAG: hypothetical protein ACPGVG_20185, partial [Mycobacterium sp.]